jgi:hypothetical protein
MLSIYAKKVTKKNDSRFSFYKKKTLLWRAVGTGYILFGLNWCIT